MKNHDIVPKELVVQIAAVRHGGADKMIQTLLRHKLLHHECKAFDGYRLTTLGYDFLAMRAFSCKGLVAGVGMKLGVGKESDVFMVENEEEKELVLKLHRLGRTSFRKIKSKRDYHGKRGSPSWIYLSRLAAQKEFAFMKALHEHGFPVPEPIEANRHCVLMGMMTGYQMHTIGTMDDPMGCLLVLLEMVVKMGKLGLIHGDFNEFNISVSKTKCTDIIMYDFPQMVSMNHPNAKYYFNRDVEGLFRFFHSRFHLDVSEVDYPDFDDVFAARSGSLDVELKASGYACEAEVDAYEEEMERARHANAQSEDEDEEEEEEEVPPAAVVEEESEESQEEEETYAQQEAKRKAKIQKEVSKSMRQQMKGNKTSRNIVKNREKRKVKESMNDVGGW
ncbi:hypothetical protein BASA81_008122 [Batrachochytrium salamandrivorans]|nr:hypothetical protein BASA81_008122 [Batrachochytrium salamandrivorans]